MNDATPPAGELFVTQFLVVSDQDRSRAFYQSVFGANVVRDRDPVILALANTRIVLNIGGDPAYREWSARGATFLTEPKDHGYEIRAYIRDPDGHLIEVGQTT